MNGANLVRFWPLIQSVIREFWEIIEPSIEEAAIRHDIPVELYYYAELGLESFSIEGFQKRDPFSNPQLFEKLFVTLNVKGWILPQLDGSYQVTQRAREAARRIIRAGDEELLPFDYATSIDLHRLAVLLRQIVLASTVAPQPPEKWAIVKRFHSVDKDSPLVVQVREYLMDLFAYRDDSHISASHPHFGKAGIIWNVLDTLWNQDNGKAGQLAEIHSFRGYDVNDYEVALQAAVQIGWAEETEVPSAYRISPQGRKIRAEAERLTDE